MSSIVHSALAVRMAPHTNGVMDFTTQPATSDLLPEKVDGVVRPDTVRLGREPAHPLNKRFGPLRGPIDISKPVPLEFIARGLSGNTGGAITAAGANEIAAAGILQALFGAAAIDPSGAVTTSTGGAGATATLSVTEQARFPVGMGVLVPTDAGTFARQVISRAGSSGAGDLTLDRAVPGTLITGNVIRASRHVVDPSVHDHIHQYLLAEWGDADIAREFLGGMSLATFDCTVAKEMRLMTSWMFTNIRDIARASTSLSPPSTGGAAVNANNVFYDGATPYFANDIKVNLGGTMTPRKANSGPAGVQGYRIAKGPGTPRPTIEVTVEAGGSAGQLDDSAVGTRQGLPLNLGDAHADHDISLQVGFVAGATWMFRMPNAHVASFEPVIVDGFDHFKVVLQGDGPSSSSFYPLEVLIY